MTDLELVDKYCEECRDFINPRLFKEIGNRGLYGIINMLPKDIREAKAVARARLATTNKFFNEPEIDAIAGHIKTLERLKNKFISINITDTNLLIPVLKDMLSEATFVNDYFKTPSIP